MGYISYTIMVHILVNEKILWGKTTQDMKGVENHNSEYNLNHSCRPVLPQASQWPWRKAAHPAPRKHRWASGARERHRGPHLHLLEWKSRRRAGRPSAPRRCTSAPASRQSLAHDRRPHVQLVMSGVDPSLLARSTSAPRATHSLAHAMWPS